MQVSCVLYNINITPSLLAYTAYKAYGNALLPVIQMFVQE